MLDSEILLDFITAEPFQPFRIKMAGGPHFDIRYPEMIGVGRTSLSVHTVLGTDQNKK